MEDFKKFRKLLADLRGENGCPWDKKQSMQTLAPYLREEADEAIVELENGNDPGACEELGDVLLIVLMLIQVAEEEKRFSFEDVIKEVSEKIVRRHPHVFGGLDVSSEEEIILNWKKIKEQEKRDKK